MPWGLKRYQQARQLHYVTFTCYHRAQFLGTPHARDVFIQHLERTRCWYGFYIVGYGVMPEHVHLLVSEPEGATLARALQMLKQTSSRKLKAIAGGNPFSLAPPRAAGAFCELTWENNVQPPQRPR